MNCKHVKNLKLVLNGYVIIHLFCFGFFFRIIKPSHCENRKSVDMFNVNKEKEMNLIHVILIAVC